MERGEFECTDETITSFLDARGSLKLSRLRRDIFMVARIIFFNGKRYYYIQRYFQERLLYEKTSRDSLKPTISAPIPGIRRREPVLLARSLARHSSSSKVALSILIAIFARLGPRRALYYQLIRSCEVCSASGQLVRERDENKKGRAMSSTRLGGRKEEEKDKESE